MEEDKSNQKEFPKLTLNTKLLNSKPQKIIEEKEKEDLNIPIKITLSRKIRWFLFSILIYLTLVMELDQGILSSSTDALAKDIDLNSNEFLVYICNSNICIIAIYTGFLFSGLFRKAVFCKYNRKNNIKLEKCLDASVVWRWSNYC